MTVNYEKACLPEKKRYKLRPVHIVRNTRAVKPFSTISCDRKVAQGKIRSTEIASTLKLDPSHLQGH